MRKRIFLVIFAMSIIIMSSYAMAFKPDNNPGLSKEKNENAPGQFKKIMEFECQKYFLNEIHSRIILRFDQVEVSPKGLLEKVEESIEPIELLLPVAIITWETPVYKNTPINFYADSSFDPDGGGIVLIEWDINGNGNYELPIVNPYPHVFDDIGIHYIGLRVTDDDGQIGTVLEEIIVEEKII